MNVLEKILEEIEKTENEYCHKEHSPMFCMGACSMAADLKEIIRSHMDDVTDTNIAESYQQDKAPAAGMEHIMSRFTKSE